MQAKKAQRRAHLEALKAARTGAKREYTATEEDTIYDVVDDTDYKAIVKGRLQEDDFIEDDDGSGYVDNGMDDWDRNDAEDAEPEQPKPARKDKAKAKAKPVPVKAPPKPYENPYIRAVPAADEADFMASLLDSMSDAAPRQQTTGYAPKADPYAIGRKRKTEAERSFREAERALKGFRTIATADTEERASTIEAPESKRLKVEDAGGMDMGDFNFDDVGDESMEVEVVADAVAVDEDDDLFIRPAVPSTSKAKAGPPVRRQLVNASVKPVVAKLEPVEDQLPPVAPPTRPSAIAKPKGMDWRTATVGLALAVAPIKDDDDEDKFDSTEADAFKAPFAPKKNGKKLPEPDLPVKHANVLEADGTLRFWWYDMLDVRGVVYLVGKVQEKDGKQAWVSGMLMVGGIQRKLYVLPREKMLDDEGEPLDDAPEVDDVMADFEDVAERLVVKTLDTTVGFTFTHNPDWVRKKYAFGIKGIPREESNWVEITYPYDEAELPLDLAGSTFSHVFGTNTAPFERLVLERKIMGPCWLNITNAQLSVKKASHCKFEAGVDISDVSVFTTDDPNAPKTIPPLTILSLSLRTVVHVADNKREVLVASARVYTDANLDDARPINEQASSVTTLVRPLLGSFPNGFEAAARAAKKRSNALLVVKDEKALLDQLLAVMARNDPDVIVGLDLLGSELDILLNRMKELKCENWSRMSRVVRKKWPRLSPGWNQSLVAGRLFCDLSSDGSKSIIESTTWSLTEMCGSHLKIEREDIDPEDTGKYFDPMHSTSAELLKYVMHCEADGYFQMAIAHKVQALLLTRQLTNLAGNSWNKTLSGNRAERNEFILLHRFTERGFVCPDKVSPKLKKAMEVKLAAAAKGLAKKNGVVEPGPAVKKDKFKGGLVFEPKRGLWDTFVLVMDFNSLYPSIIQEYDIDFTTLDWTADDAEDLEKMPERAPVEGEPQGVLPQLIFFLVDRRRNVKKLMKDKSTTPGKLLQYDITQKALKLTANSMYGCLGYEQGRFYARPLAALTTFKGREILTRTKADAESLALDVIYGDTDSVMINTNVTDYAAAIKIGNDFKKLINDKYKKLEIDTDAVFQRMLLLQKKKYAAVKVEEDGTKETEIKGLDMKRREYCELSKGASRFVLGQILSGEDTETVIEAVHNFLAECGESIRAGKIPLEEYIIYKRLGKNPQDYPDAKSLPHVQVAMRMKAKGQIIKAGDVIPYIFCLGADGVGEKTGKADKAFSPDEIRKADSGLKIDFEVYIASQVLPPIERLCEAIEGTDRARLAECLGLDPSRYQNAVVQVDNEKEFKTLQSQVSDAERFAAAKLLLFRCRHCSCEYNFDGALKNSAQLLTPLGFVCPESACAKPFSMASLAVQLDLQIRAEIGLFYEAWLVCDDQACGNRTRMMSVYGKRCLVQYCRGQMHPEYSDSKLYNQLLYYSTLFDIEKSRAHVVGTARFDEIQALTEQNKVSLTQLGKVVTKYLDRNGRRWVGMAGLFGFMQLA